jgi:tetratricopeptide (TPR) repeat protein
MSVKPMVFVAMPFGTKKDPKSGLTIDFDSIYERGIKPAVDPERFECIRADEERGGGIIHQAMFERLLLAEIAIVDVTIENPNVFYELGVRHAARPSATIIVRGGDGPLPFDIGLIRTVPYPLDNGRLSDAGAASLKAALVEKLADARRAEVSQDSPLFQLIPKFPGIDLPPAATESFRERARAADALRDRLELARRTKNAAEIDSIANGLDPNDQNDASALIDVMLSYRDLERYDDMIALLERAPHLAARSVALREQHALALNRRNKGDDRERAIKLLEDVVRVNGDSPETCGIVGRIYKDRYKEALGRNERRATQANLEQACDWYRRGFLADPRDYYPGINLVTLLASANTEESLAELRRVLPAVAFAVARLGGIQTSDYWQIATVMELAVHGGDFALADRSLTRLLGLTPPVPSMALNSMADQLQTIGDAGRGDVDGARLAELIADIRAAAVRPPAAR